MTETYDLVVSGGRCFTPGGLVDLDIGVRDGRVAFLGAVPAKQGGAVLDAANLVVLPGLIDTQVHFREPGHEHKEDLATGTAAAVAGGIATVFEMPNTHPGTTTASAIEDKLRRAKGRAWCDHAFFVGATAENIDALAELETLPGCCGVKVFMGSSTGDLLLAGEEELDRVFANGRRRIAIHAEDEALLQARRSIVDGGAAVSQHPVWRNEETAFTATRRAVETAQKRRRPIHILHVTTAEEMAYLGRNKRLVTVEVTPQHLTLCAPECYEQLGTRAQMNPPIRSAGHRAGLWRGVADGTVDVIGSDHAPHTLEEKSGAYPDTPSGMPGVQTTVPLMLDHVHHGRLSLARMVDLLAAGPARIYGIRGKGRLAVGYDADFTLVDLQQKHVISDGEMRSKSGWTPFCDTEVVGFPVATIVRGNMVMRESELVGSPCGEAVEF